MNSIVMAGIAPHPPLIIPDIGRGEIKKVEKTVEAMKTLAQEVKKAQPDTIVVISPHGPVFRNAVAFLGGEKLKGSMARFGVPEVALEVPNDEGLMTSILAEARQMDLPVFIMDEATSSIDTETEERIQKASAKLLGGRTAFIIAHRVTTIRRADKILVIQNGRIIEQGSHSELLNRKKQYYKLYMQQFMAEYA